MPNHYSHTIYKEYIDMLRDENKKKAHEAEQVSDEIQDAVSP